MPEKLLLGFIALLFLFALLGWFFERARREEIAARYKGSELGQLILDRKICQGMSAWELTESWGPPDAKERTVLKTKEKETWLYGKDGRGYLNRVYLENGYVVGWKQKN